MTMNPTLELRHRLAIDNICTPSGLTDMSAYEPFVSGRYPHARRLGRMTQEPWLTITGQNPATLVPIDPYAPSQYRPGRTAVWDAAAGIPAARIRPRALVDAGKATPVRSCNTTWLGPITRGMTRIGPILPGGQFVRPNGQFIVDLLYNTLGWKILEGAHILTHRRHRDYQKKQIEAGLPVTSKYLQRYVAELVTCMQYGLPVDVGEEVAPTRLAVAQYGLDIRVSDRFRSPVMKVPWSNENAPIPDRTMGFISTGVFIEPVPAGAILESENWLECNRWTCLPTMVSIAGWEMVDVVSHFPVGLLNPFDQASAKCYVVHPADLMPPDTLPDLMEAAIAARGKPMMDGVRYFRVEDWLDSADYKRGLAVTPPFPCSACLCYNQRTDGAPERPRTLWKDHDEQSLREQREHADWNRVKARIMRIATRATVFFESGLYGGRSRATLVRALRKRAYARELAYAHKVRVLEKRVAKEMEGGVPSAAHRTRLELDTLIRKHKEEVDKCYQLESTSELPGA